MTIRAEPALNSSRAIIVTAWGAVRSPMPIMTAPLPIGMTSPPSTVARPQSWSASPCHTLTPPVSANIGWKR
jgi:hypothetical protein